MPWSQEDEPAGIDDGLEALDFVGVLAAFGDGAFVDPAAVGHSCAVESAIGGQVVSGGDFLGAVGDEACVDPDGDELADVAVGVDFEDRDSGVAALVGPTVASRGGGGCGTYRERSWAFPCRPCLR